jgi:hypothetical protein
VKGEVLHIYIFGKHIVKGDVGDYRLNVNRLKTNRPKAEGRAPICGIYAPLRKAEGTA